MVVGEVAVVGQLRADQGLFRGVQFVRRKGTCVNYVRPLRQDVRLRDCVVPATQWGVPGTHPSGGGGVRPAHRYSSDKINITA